MSKKAVLKTKLQSLVWGKKEYLIQITEFAELGKKLTDDKNHGVFFLFQTAEKGNTYSDKEMESFVSFSPHFLATALVTETYTHKKNSEKI